MKHSPRAGLHARVSTAGQQTLKNHTATHRFNAGEYYHMGELGLLSERTEPIDGIIIDMEPIGPWHADIVDILTQAFAGQALTRFRVRVQELIDLGLESQPQPDLVLCRAGRYEDRHPVPADIFLSNGALQLTRVINF